MVALGNLNENLEIILKNLFIMTDVGDLHADLLEGYFMFSFCNGRVTLCIFVVPIVYDGD